MLLWIAWYREKKPVYTILILVILLVGVRYAPIASTVDDTTVIASVNDIMQSEGSSSLPEVNLTITIEDRIAETSIKAILHFGVVLEPDSILVGFDQYPVITNDGEDAVPVTGISYSQRSEYPFAYGNDEVLLDNWERENPAAISGNPAHPWPIWDTSSEEGQYIGPIRSENISQMNMVGYVLEYSNLSICLADGEVVEIGSGKVTIGLNFTRNGDGWASSMILQGLESEEYTLGTFEILITIDGCIPIDPNWSAISTDVGVETMGLIPPPGAIMSVSIIIIGIASILFRRKRN